MFFIFYASSSFSFHFGTCLLVSNHFCPRCLRPIIWIVKCTKGPCIFLNAGKFMHVIGKKWLTYGLFLYNVCTHLRIASGVMVITSSRLSSCYSPSCSSISLVQLFYWPRYNSYEFNNKTIKTRFIPFALGQEGPHF